MIAQMNEFDISIKCKLCGKYYKCLWLCIFCESKFSFVLYSQCRQVIGTSVWYFIIQFFIYPMDKMYRVERISLFTLFSVDVSFVLQEFYLWIWMGKMFIIISNVCTQCTNFHVNEIYRNTVQYVFAKFVLGENL